MTTGAESIVTALADAGVTQVWGVVGDALNSVTDAIRRDDRGEWIGVRHEEAAAFAVSAQSQLSGVIGVCMGTVGPGSIHLLNGLYDAKKSRAPVLAICGQVPSADMGSDYFQEVDNDRLFADVAVYDRTVTAPEQLPGLLERAVNAAFSEGGVAVFTLPGDIGGLDLLKDAGVARFAPPAVIAPAPQSQRAAAATVLSGDGAVTLLVGCGSREARDQVLELADRLAAPMVLTLKAKERLEHENAYQVGQSGLIGNPAAAKALDDCDVLFLVGTDFPFSEWYPKNETGATSTRRWPPSRSDTAASRACSTPTTTTASSARCGGCSTIPTSASGPRRWRQRSTGTRPTRRSSPATPACRRPDWRGSSPCTAPAGWSVRTTSARWPTPCRRPFGARALDRTRTVVACCGDGGPMMLLGDLRTAVTYRLPIRVVVFNNSRLGMVKLEQEQGGLPEFGTDLDNPDIAAVAAAMGLASRRVTEPGSLDEVVAWAMAHDGPMLLDVVTNPDGVAIPPKPTLAQGWGFAVAKSKEIIESP